MNWTQEQLLLALHLYFQIPFGQFHQRNPKVMSLASFIGRTPSAVAMKLANFASLDPNHRERGVRGLRNASRADKKAWEEFVGGRELAGEDTIIAPFVDVTLLSDAKAATEMVRKTKVRLLQHRFRRHILENYQERCCICDLPIPALLVASHIIAWSERQDLRLEPTNGLCLCSLHDKAYEIGWVGITPDYQILISSRISSHFPHRALEVNFETYHQQKIHLPQQYPPDAEFLRTRYERFVE